ncbi:hypothetical protein BDC45DRAFT_571691 [Circinella umbellata]|nr:hypothetical protein BDC45DRAFT_571691 [Circinella umbellata]
MSTTINSNDIPNDVWIHVFRMLNSKDSFVTCALVCRTWCYMIQNEFITNKAAKEIFDPFSPTRLKCIKMNQEWLSECLTFICARRLHYTIEKLEIEGLTYQHLKQLKTFFRLIEPTSLQQVAFYDAHIALEKFAPTIFETFPNLSEFTVAFTSDIVFKRRTEPENFLKKSSTKFKLKHLWLQLRDDGFEKDTNSIIAKKLIKNSPHLTQIFVESMATTAHEGIIDMWSLGQCPNLEVLGMTHYGRIRQLLAHPIVKEIRTRNNDNNNLLNKVAKQKYQKRGLRVLAITENHIRYHYYDYVKIKEEILKKVHNTLELLFLENLYPSSHVTWAELFSCCTKDVVFPRLRHVILHLGKTCSFRSVFPASLREQDFEGKLCTLLSQAHQLENFTYRRDLRLTRYLEMGTWITDKILQTLIEHCPGLTTFQVAGCYRFSSNKLRQFIQAFRKQLKTVEFDCSIGGDNLKFVVETLKYLQKISVRHICSQSHNCPNIPQIDEKNILLTWGGSYDITALDDINCKLYDIF